MLHYDAWQGIKALAEYNSKQASHARVSLLFYLGMRASSGYIWGSIETIAADNALSKEAAGRLMRDLENVGAIELTPHTEIPPHVRAMIETSYPLKPAKKVWRLTGFYCIEGETYQYLYNGDGAANVGKPNNSNVGNSNNWKSQPNIIDSKDKEKESIEDSFSASIDTGQEIQKSTDEPTQHEKSPRTVVKRDSFEYVAIEQAVKTHIYNGVDSIGMQCGALIQFLVIGKHTPKQLIAFKQWYLARYNGGTLPRQIKRVKGTDEFEGKFVTHWQEWQKVTAPKVSTQGAITPPPVIVPTLTTEQAQNSLALLKGKRHE